MEFWDMCYVCHPDSTFQTQLCNDTVTGINQSLFRVYNQQKPFLVKVETFDWHELQYFKVGGSK